MKIIVGLGNPGKEYEETRHNIGFKIIESLAQKFTFEPFHLEKKFKAALTIGETALKKEKIIFAKPQTYMNLSGEAVAALMNFYKIETADMWVIYDDLDLPLGKIRIRKEGSAGTHNGMKSIITQIGKNNFPRFRFGIESRGQTAPKQQDTTSFVLSPFTIHEQPLVEETVQKMIEALQQSLDKGIEVCMNTFNI